MTARPGPRVRSPAHPGSVRRRRRGAVRHAGQSVIRRRDANAAHRSPVGRGDRAAVVGDPAGAGLKGGRRWPGPAAGGAGRWQVLAICRIGPQHHQAKTDTRRLSLRVIGCLLCSVQMPPVWRAPAQGVWGAPAPRRFRRNPCFRGGPTAGAAGRARRPSTIHPFSVPQRPGAPGRERQSGPGARRWAGAGPGECEMRAPFAVSAAVGPREGADLVLGYYQEVDAAPLLSL